jgi:hypothetical protein
LSITGTAADRVGETSPVEGRGGARGCALGLLWSVRCDAGRDRGGCRCAAGDLLAGSASMWCRSGDLSLGWLKSVERGLIMAKKSKKDKKKDKKNKKKK